MHISTSLALAVSVLVYTSHAMALNANHPSNEQLARRSYATSFDGYGSGQSASTSGSWYDNGVTGGSSWRTGSGGSRLAASKPQSGITASQGSWWDNGTTGGSAYSATRNPNYNSGAHPSGGSYSTGSSGSYSTGSAGASKISNDGWDPIPLNPDTSKMHTIHYGPDGSVIGQSGGSKGSSGNTHTAYNQVINGKMYDQVTQNGAALLSKDGWDPIPTNPDLRKTHTIHYGPDGSMIGQSGGKQSSSSSSYGYNSAFYDSPSGSYSTGQSTSNKGSYSANQNGNSGGSYSSRPSTNYKPNGSRASYGNLASAGTNVYSDYHPSNKKNKNKKYKNKKRKNKNRKVKKVTKITYYD